GALRHGGIAEVAGAAHGVDAAADQEVAHGGEGFGRVDAVGAHGGGEDRAAYGLGSAQGRGQALPHVAAAEALADHGLVAAGLGPDGVAAAMEDLGIRSGALTAGGDPGAVVGIGPGRCEPFLHGSDSRAAPGWMMRLPSGQRASSVLAWCMARSLAPRTKTDMAERAAYWKPARPSRKP